jgi:hypothetical protein
MCSALFIEAAMMSVKEQIVTRIHVGMRQLSTALFVGRLQDAYGWKNYVEGYISCAEVAGIIEHVEALSFRQSVQRVAKGERPPETPSFHGPPASSSAS